MAQYTINYLTGDTETLEAEAVNCDDQSRMYVFRGSPPHYQAVALIPFTGVRSVVLQPAEAAEEVQTLLPNERAQVAEDELKKYEIRQRVDSEGRRLLAADLGLVGAPHWDDLRAAVVGRQKLCDAQVADLEQLRAGEEPTIDEHIVPTPGQWIWKWNRSTPEKRLGMAAQILDAMSRASDCFTSDHEAQIASLRAEAERLAKWKIQILDALGMNHSRDWDDIRNAAYGIRKQRDAQAETLERVRNLPEQPEVMDSQHPDPNGYLHGYGVAIREAKRATWREVTVDNAADVAAEHDPSRRA